MAAAFGISSLPSGLTAPADCAVQSVETKEIVESSTYRDQTGVTVGVIPHKIITREVTIEVVGRPALTGVIAGAFADGTLKMISAKYTENVDGPPSGTITYKAYESISSGGEGG